MNAADDDKAWLDDDQLPVPDYYLEKVAQCSAAGGVWVPRVCAEALAARRALPSAREQGYREGYTRALSDVQLHLSSAIHAAYDSADPKTYVTTLQHARDIVAGLAGLRGLTGF